MNHSSSVLIMSATAVGQYGSKHTPLRTPKRAFQMVANGAGNITVEVYGSNVPEPGTSNDGEWILLGTIALTPAGAKVSDGFTTDAPWRHIRGKCTVQTGTASAEIYMGG